MNRPTPRIREATEEAWQLQRDPCGFTEAVDEDAIDELTDEQVDQVLSILDKIK